MSYKRKVLAGALVVGTLGAAGLAMPLSIMAATADSTSAMSTFVQKLAVELGISEDAVQTAVSSVQDDIKSERDAEYAAALATAVSEGKLTQRQADVLSALIEAQLERLSEPGTQVDPSTLTEEQRQAERETRQAEMRQKILDALNAKGLNVTADELESTQTAARTAGLRGGGFGARGPGGPGGMPL